MDRLFHDDSPTYVYIGAILGKGGIECTKRIALNIEIVTQTFGHCLWAMRDLFVETIHSYAFRQRSPRR